MSQTITVDVGDLHYQMYQQLQQVAGEEEISQNMRKLFEDEVHQAFQELQQQQDRQMAEREAMVEEQQDVNEQEQVDERERIDGEEQTDQEE